jgi:hypothetical protein
MASAFLGYQVISPFLRKRPGRTEGERHLGIRDAIGLKRSTASSGKLEFQLFLSDTESVSKGRVRSLRLSIAPREGVRPTERLHQELPGRKFQKKRLPQMEEFHPISAFLAWPTSRWTPFRFPRDLRLSQVRVTPSLTCPGFRGIAFRPWQESFKKCVLPFCARALLYRSGRKSGRPGDTASGLSRSVDPRSKIPLEERRRPSDGNSFTNGTRHRIPWGKAQMQPLTWWSCFAGAQTDFNMKSAQTLQQ